MAETKMQRESNRSQNQKQSEQQLARPQGNRAASRRDPRFTGMSNPFEFMERVSEEMDRWFEQMTGGRGFSRPSLFSRARTGSHLQGGMWFPRVEAIQKEDRFLVRADLPGLKKEDINVELTEDAITIHGERREERQDEREGYWRSEREYGEFHRTIPLPEGVISESAEATFRDGVLEITMQCAPEEANRGRRIDIRDASEERK